jgi:uncharacterized tellurite resistance protein B-like protein
MARIVIAALLADGSIDNTELAVLKKAAVIEQLNLSPDEFERIVEEFCNDLQSTALHHNGGQMRLSRETIKLLLNDVRATPLRLHLLAILSDIVSADGQLSRDETNLMAQVMTQWGSELGDQTRYP